MYVFSNRAQVSAGQFYKFLHLEREVSAAEKQLFSSRLIGTVPGNHDWGVGDGWYASRIEKMIADNKLEVVEYKDKSRPDGKILRKS
jgi:hypothetical protein